MCNKNYLPGGNLSLPPVVLGWERLWETKMSSKLRCLRRFGNTGWEEDIRLHSLKKGLALTEEDNGEGLLILFTSNLLPLGSIFSLSLPLSSCEEFRHTSFSTLLPLLAQLSLFKKVFIFWYFWIIKIHKHQFLEVIFC